MEGEKGGGTDRRRNGGRDRWRNGGRDRRRRRDRGRNLTSRIILIRVNAMTLLNCIYTWNYAAKLF